jgi:hypothetical protein
MALRAASADRAAIGSRDWYVHELRTDIVRRIAPGDRGVLAGQVRLALTDLPLSGLTISAVPTDSAAPARHATLATDGGFFIGALSDGEYALVVDRHVNFSPFEFEIAEQRPVLGIELLVDAAQEETEEKPSPRSASS